MNYTADKLRYDKIPYKRCGKSGLLLPPISLGLWHNFGGTNDYETSKNMLLHGFDNGITHFDLANNYGPPPGSAELTMGKVLKSELNSYRDELIISSKAGYDMWPGPYGEWGSKKYLIASLDQSLKRMGLEYVDIFYSHRPDPNTPFEETMGALEQIVRSGKALYVGLSNYTAEQTQDAVSILKSLGTSCLIHQPKYSMFERWVENGLLDVLEEHGIGCITFSPLAQGLLSDKYINGIPKDSRIAGSSIFLGENALTEDTLRKISSLNTLAKERGQSLAQMALAWLLKDKRITSVLIGVSKISQIDDSLAAVKNLEFSEEELNTINQILAK
ncbi:MAG: L-glyceraldehyde 3-phosphate reductase [Bacteroidales bacterium]|jgi:L-glyceraldehyde 3-phosphate reductase|nr:L-glyceraldehyde 3-phosphate reductase [Bacteroidales bacterium]